MSGTCLFSNKALDDRTKHEHTIPRSMCGRITSNSVTCSEFNAASSKCDGELRKEFLLHLCELAPVLPKEFNPGEVPVILDNGVPAIRRNGFIKIKNFYISKYDLSGRPKEILHSNDSKSILRTLKKLGIQAHTHEEVPLPGDMAFIKGIPICSIQAEISILKSILCTIDVILQKERMPLFTRSEEISPLKAFISKAVVQECDDIDIVELDSYYLGVQLSDQKEIENALSYHDYKAKPFEHVILFSSNTATKTLDAVWNIFSHEAHGVRLATRWNGPRVCGFIANPIFMNETISYGIRFEEENPFFKIKKTPIKGFCVEKQLPPDFSPYIRKIREQTWFDIISYVEVNNDQHLLESFRETSRFTDQKSMLDILISRLAWTFRKSYGDSLETELEIIKNNCRKWENQSSVVLLDDTNMLIPQFLHDYKTAFSALDRIFYPPSQLTYKMHTNT